jgi:hypothetical protein
MIQKKILGSKSGLAHHDRIFQVAYLVVCLGRGDETTILLISSYQIMGRIPLSLGPKNASII